MYSNFNFQIFEKSGFFLIHHKGITKNSQASPLPSTLHINPRWGSPMGESYGAPPVSQYSVCYYFVYKCLIIYINNGNERKGS